MAALTWRFTAPASVSIGANNADDFLAGINTIVTANSGAADAIWEVANYSSSSPKSVLLRRKDGSPGRIIYFGQQGGTPNAAAIRTGAGASRLIVAYSQSSTASTPDASFLSAAPLSATDYMPGICAANVTTNRTYRMYYAESSAGMVFINLYYVQAFNGAVTVEAGYSCAGDLFVHKSNTNCPMLLSQGNGGVSSWTAPTTNAFVDAGYTTSYSGGPICVVRYGGNIERLFRLSLAAAAQNENILRDDSDNRMTFVPVWMGWQQWNPINSGFAGKLRQLCYGPQALQETFLHSSSTDAVIATAICPAVAAVGDAMWIANVEV